MIPPPEIDDRKSRYASGANVIEFPWEERFPPLNRFSRSRPTEPAVILILPVVRIERCDVDTISPDHARKRRAWYTMKRRLKEGTLLTGPDG